MSVLRLPRHLRSRLFLSYLVVVAAGATAMFIVGTVVTRTAYQHQINMFGLGHGRGRETPVSEAQLQNALDESLVPALLIGTAAALAAAALVAWFVGRRLLRPIDELRAAARSMAAGDYSVRVPIPAEIELATLAADVNALGEHLSTTEQRRTELMAEVAHELRTPITVIRGQMEGVIDGIIQPSDEVYVAVAEEAARMQRLVEDLTTLSRAEEGALRLEPVELDLGEVAGTVADRLRPQFDHVSVSLVIDTAASTPVIGDRDRLTQVITNLLGNALGHTPSSGIVTLRSGRDEGAVWIDVADTGAGISAGDLDHVFDRFFRGPDVSRAVGRPTRAGRGIGLTIARSLARAHGGEVRATSPGLGNGATFRLSMPADATR